MFNALPALPAGATMNVGRFLYSTRPFFQKSLCMQSRIAILPVIAMAEGERWVRGDCRYEFPL